MSDTLDILKKDLERHQAHCDPKARTPRQLVSRIVKFVSGRNQPLAESAADLNIKKSQLTAWIRQRKTFHPKKQDFRVVEVIPDPPVDIHLKLGRFQLTARWNAHVTR